MRRADRLFAIVQMLRGRRLTTARQMAERFRVSERTIYRDIQELALSVSIAGEAGVGYTLSKDYDIPPIMFDADELEALVIGARMVGAWGSPSLSEAAERALEKIRGVVPAARRVQMEATQIFAPDFHISKRIGPAFEALRQAIRDRTVMHLQYSDESGRNTARDIRPLALHFWGERWTVAAWCEKRRDFRLFRLDRMQGIESTARRFCDEAGKTYADFLRSVNSR